MLSSLAYGQTITVRLLNAKSGKPMAGQNVTLDWGGNFESTKARMNESGTAQVEIPKGAANFVMLGGPRNGKEPRRIAYFDCNEKKTVLISVQEVLDKGFVPKNVCGKQSTAARPGEVIFWALPLPWWQPDMQ